MSRLNKPNAGKIYTVEVRRPGKDWEFVCSNEWPNGYATEFTDAEAYSIALLHQHPNWENRVIAEYIGIGKQLVAYRVNLS